MRYERSSWIGRHFLSPKSWPLGTKSEFFNTHAWLQQSRADDLRYNRSAGLQDMAVWQFRVIFVPERVLLSKYDVLPRMIAQELAEDFSWWADVQPPARFEDQIDLILPKMD